MCACACSSVFVSTCMYVGPWLRYLICLRLFVGVFVCVHVCVCVCASACMHVFVCVFAVCVCMFV